jgi:hypothetical protein
LTVKEILRSHIRAKLSMAVLEKGGSRGATGLVRNVGMGPNETCKKGFLGVRLNAPRRSVEYAVGIYSV